jgi:hypothetical protein
MSGQRRANGHAAKGGQSVLPARNHSEYQLVNDENRAGTRAWPLPARKPLEPAYPLGGQRANIYTLKGRLYKNLPIGLGGRHEV